MLAVIGISLSLLVILSGLYLLAKSKKESLGNLYIFSSYSAIVLGGLLFAGTIVGGAMKMHHHRNYSPHHGIHSSSHCGGGSCHMNAYSQGHCAKGGKCARSGQCSGKCGNGGQGGHGHHEGGHGHHGDHHGGKMHKKMRKHHDGDSKVEIEIEIDEEDDDE